MKQKESVLVYNSTFVCIQAQGLWIFCKIWIICQKFNMFKKKLVKQYLSETSSTEESDVSMIFKDNKWVKPMSTSSTTDTEVE